MESRFDRAEAGYWWGQPYWGQGLATAALAAVLRFSFTELRLHKACAAHIAGNPASGRVVLKNGLVKEGELGQPSKRGGQYHNLWQYRLPRQEYAQPSKPRAAYFRHKFYTEFLAVRRVFCLIQRLNCT